MSIASDKARHAYHQKAQEWWDVLYAGVKESVEKYNNEHSHNPAAHLACGEWGGEHKTEFAVHSMQASEEHSVRVERATESAPHVISIQNPDGSVLKRLPLKWENGEIEAQGESGQGMTVEDMAALIVNAVKRAPRS